MKLPLSGTGCLRCWVELPLLSKPRGSNFAVCFLRPFALGCLKVTLRMERMWTRMECPCQQIAPGISKFLTLVLCLERRTFLATTLGALRLDVNQSMDTFIVDRLQVLLWHRMELAPAPPIPEQPFPPAVLLIQKVLHWEDLAMRIGCCEVVCQALVLGWNGGFAPGAHLCFASWCLC